MQDMQETQLPSLVWEDPLEEEMATHSSVLAWRIPWTEQPSGLLPRGGAKSHTPLSTCAHMLSYVQFFASPWTAAC